MAQTAELRAGDLVLKLMPLSTISDSLLVEGSILRGASAERAPGLPAMLRWSARDASATNTTRSGDPQPAVLTPPRSR